MVDAGIAVSREKVEAALAEIGPGKLVYLINTHWHWDHTDGNAWMHAAGATIIGRPQTRERLAVSTRVNDWDYTFRPMPAAARPTIIVKKDESLDFDGETVFIHPYGRAHTDTDPVGLFQPGRCPGHRRYLLERLVSVHRTIPPAVRSMAPSGPPTRTSPAPARPPWWFRATVPSPISTGW